MKEIDNDANFVYIFDKSKGHIQGVISIIITTCTYIDKRIAI